MVADLFIRKDIIILVRDHNVLKYMCSRKPCSLLFCHLNCVQNEIHLNLQGCSLEFSRNFKLSCVHTSQDMSLPY